MDQNTEDQGVNHTIGANNAIPGNPPRPIPTDKKSTPKVETVGDESDAEEDETEKEETIQDEEGFEFQLISPSPAEQHVW